MKTVVVLLLLGLAAIATAFFFAEQSVHSCEAQGGHISAVQPTKGRCVK